MRHRIGKAAVVLTTLSLAAVGLSGCAGSSSNADTFTYWSMWKKGEPQQVVLQKAIDGFTKKTGIKVNVQWSGRDVLTQVVPRLNAGNPPDLIDQGDTDVAAALGPVNGTLDLTKLYGMKVMGESQTVGDVIPPALVDTVRDKNGKPYLVPYELWGSAIWYNSKVTPSLESDTPKDWDAFLSSMDALKAQGRTPVSIEGSNPDNDGFWMWWALTRAGGKDTLLKAAQDKSGDAFTSPAWVSATDAIGTMIKNDYFPAGFNATKYPAQQAGWADQSIKSDVMIMGSWLPSETDASLTKEGKDPSQVIDYHSFPFPSIGSADKGDEAAQVSAIGFAITSKAKHATAAEKFVTYFLQKDVLSGIATTAKNMTPRTDVAAPPELADYAKEYAAAKSYVTLFDGISGATPKWYSDIWLPALSDFFGGKLTAEQFRQELHDKTVQYYKQ
jgi:ABC-type glycerol-3-phosphate transport system substrate-binding protein